MIKANVEDVAFNVIGGFQFERAHVVHHGGDVPDHGAAIDVERSALEDGIDTGLIDTGIIEVKLVNGQRFKITVEEI